LQGQISTKPGHFLGRFLYGPLLTLVLFGCGGPTGPVTVPVSGSVSLDGKPVPSGQIIFNDVAGAEKAYAGLIIDGRFSFPSTVGQKKVSISSPQEVTGKSLIIGGTPGDPVSADNPALQILETVPAKYNEKSTLTADVTSSGDNTFPFELTSQ